MNEPSYLRWRLAQFCALGVAFRVAWRRMWRLGLGDRAETVGRSLLLVQGTAAPLWECKDTATGEHVHAQERDMRKVRTLRNYFGSFRSGWRWWMTSWFSIEVGRRLGIQGAFYGTRGALSRRQRRFDKRYLRDAEKRRAASPTT